MSQIKELLEISELEKVWEKSTEKPVIVFKQSTTCPISASAFGELQRFMKNTEADLATYYVKVRETRDVSNQIAEELEIQHQSPQILLVKDNKAVWHASHNKITVDSITDALENN